MDWEGHEQLRKQPALSAGRGVSAESLKLEEEMVGPGEVKMVSSRVS